MEEGLKKTLLKAVEQEPLAKTMGIKLIDLDLGYSKVEMTYHPESMDNIYQRAHGGAIYSLIDEAFETACQTHGTIAVALNINVSYISSPEPGSKLYAEASETSRTKRIAHYDIKVVDQNDHLIATCKSVAFRTGKPIPFYEGSSTQ